MEFNFFGKVENPTMLFIHAALTNYTMYMDAIEELAKEYYVIVPNIPGHELDNKTEFISLEYHAKEIEIFLIENGYKNIYAIYGFCMGGGFAIKLIDNGNIGYEKVILDAAMTPYKLPKIFCRLILLRDYYGILYYRSSYKNFEKLFQGKTWSKEVKESFYNLLQGISKKTIKNVFWSVNNYKLQNKQIKDIQNIEYWYGELEKKEREWDISYIKEFFPNIKFRVFDGMDHGEECIMNGVSYAKKLKEYYMANKK